MNFWIMALGFTLLIAVICFYPLLRNTRQTQSEKREQLNKALYFSRLKEIEQDVEQGLLENPEQAKVELQRTLLDDVGDSVENPVSQAPAYNKVWFVSGFLVLAIVASGAYSLVGSWQAETMIEQTYAKLPDFYQRIKQEAVNPLNQSEMQQFSTALRVDLQKNPNNAKKWWLLGQLGMNLDNPQLALNSYQRANQLEPENVDYKLGYARILMFSDDSIDKQQGSELLKQVIRQDHTNLEALSLLAFRYFETEDYKMAAVTWEMMLKLLPENDPKVPLIEKSIQAAKNALEQTETPKK